MSGSESLSQRIEAEFNASAKRAQSAEQAKTEQRQGRETRLDQFNKLCDDLKAVWRPKLEEFAKRFGDKVKVTPLVSPSLREAKMGFATDLATVTLTISIAPDEDVRKLVLDYDLLIVPILFEYERHARLEMPLDKVDRDALGRWIDDRLVACVRSYLSLQENEHYLKRAMVEDPISTKQFLRSAARATFELSGRTYYFESDETLAQFKSRQGIATDSAAAAAGPRPEPKAAAPTAGAARVPAVDKK